MDILLKYKGFNMSDCIFPILTTQISEIDKYSKVNRVLKTINKYLKKIGKHLKIKAYLYELNLKQLLMSKKSRQILGRILIVIFAFYYANICFFYHSHIINGVTIVHSHIHNKAHTQTSTHSVSELILISTLSSFQSFQVNLCFAGLGIFLFLQAIICLFFKGRIIPKSVACISLRAPPHVF